MALSTHVTQHGVEYQFGFPGDSEPPSEFGETFIPRAAELRYEAEVFAQAQDGEGHTDSIVKSASAMRKITGTFTGYIMTGFTIGAFPDLFTFVGRTFIVRNISVPHRKGEFSEVSVECESYGLIGTNDDL